MQEKMKIPFHVTR